MVNDKDNKYTPQIKICGLTSPKEAIYLNENKVDFAGFVLFFEKSKRCIDLGCAQRIMSELNPDIKKVAVTVSPSVEQINTISEMGFDYIQIHGNMPVNAKFNIPVLKAFNVTDMKDVASYENNNDIFGFVFDAVKPGSGQTFDWKLLDSINSFSKPFFLAGGLNAQNASLALEYTKPYALDVSSGVEYDDKPGKDPKKIKRFVENIRAFIS